MRVLVSAASKHGATSEIAREIADRLTKAGLEAVVLEPDAITTLDGFDAVVLGSGVYVGHWMDDATHVVERHGPELAARPVWLFSSGPIGEPARPDEGPVDVAEVMAATGAREHRIFAGRVDKAGLGLGERVLLKAVRAQEGDFRPWDEIRAWADQIAATLTSGPPGGVR